MNQQDVIDEQFLNEAALQGMAYQQENSGEIVAQDIIVDNHDRQAPVYRYSQPGQYYRFIWFSAVVLELLIGFRIFLKLIAANPDAGFASLIYNLSAPFLWPFAGLTVAPSAHGSILEISSIIAMVVYALVFWLLTLVIRLFWRW